MSTGIYVGLSSGNVGIGTGGINGTGSKLNVTGDISAGFLIGQVSFFTMSTAPTGWLKCNGAAISRTTYAKLFAVTGTTYGVGNGSTTFNLPDLRGEFIRGWDDGRGADPNTSITNGVTSTSTRAFGSYQSHAFQQISGTVAGGARETTGVFVRGALSVYADQDDGGPVNAMYNYSMDSSTQTNASTETRPRNLALLACIKF